MDVSDFKSRIYQTFHKEYEAQKAQLFLLFPVFIACGIGIYFYLPYEPPLIIGVLCLGAAGGLIVPPQGRERIGYVLLFLIALGFFATQMRTHIAHTSLLEGEVGPTMIEGDIRAIEDFGKSGGARVILSNLVIEDVESRETPRKVRLKIRNDEGLGVGQRIKVLGKLHAPSPPVMPGGFDFQRYLYFQGIGGVGFTYKDMEVLRPSRRAGIALWSEQLRSKVSQRIEAAIEYPQAALAMALMVGRKTAIESEDKEAMRVAGLAHMLAISGLHVGLLSGVVFFVVRLVLVLVPGFALRRPVKKYAAILAIMSACGYMFLAGATIPTQRALFMTGLVFTAIIFDRSPISLRLVAFAACVVLLFFPESLMSASFHMSFAAVTCLIAFYDWLRPYWQAWSAQGGFLRKAGLYFAGVCMTTTVATVATAPFAVFHFQQLAVYGVVGNFLAMPVLAFFIMPSIVIALVLMPFHLEFMPFKVTEIGVDILLKIAHWVESLPHAVMKTQIWPLSALVVVVVASMILLLLRTRFKWSALPLLLVCVFTIINYNQYSILISSSNKLMMYTDKKEEFLISGMRAERFARDNWLQSYGVDKSVVKKFPKEGALGPVTCDEYACRIIFEAYTLSYLHEKDARALDCAQADIVIAPFSLKKCEAAHVIDYYAGREEGAHGIYIDKDGALKIVSASDLRGRRPWASINPVFQRFEVF